MLTWERVSPGDEYTEPGDTHCVDTRDYAYYWNARRKVLRRYGKRGGYQEVPYRHMPTADNTGRLNEKLSAVFTTKREHVYSEPA